MCNHGDMKRAEYVPALSGIWYTGGTYSSEVYRCECGALFDLRHPDNDEGNPRAITARELDNMVKSLLQVRKSQIVDKVLAGVKSTVRGL